jgi:hypothetical protein
MAKTTFFRIEFRMALREAFCRDCAGSGRGAGNYASFWKNDLFPHYLSDLMGPTAWATLITIGPIFSRMHCGACPEGTLSTAGRFALEDWRCRIYENLDT